MVIILFKTFLEQNEEARRIFGKKEIEIMLKQLDGFSLTQSEKNRLSRDIKPKLRFISESSGFIDEFELKKNQENKRVIDNSVKAILNDELKQNIMAILLFGSFADNSFTKSSDIDLAAVFKKDISLKDATLFRKRVLANLADKVDLQVFNVLPFKVKEDIARNHKVLYKDKEYSNINFTIKYLKDRDFYIRKERIYGG